MQDENKYRYSTNLPKTQYKYLPNLLEKAVHAWISNSMLKKVLVGKLNRENLVDGPQIPLGRQNQR